MDYDGVDMGSHDGHGHHGDLGHGHGNTDHDGDHSHSGQAVHEALMVAHSHCGTHQGHDHMGGVAFAHHAAHSFEAISAVDTAHRRQDNGLATNENAAERHEREEAFKRKVEEAKTNPNRRYYGCHVVGHGSFDIPAAFAKLAAEMGVIRICSFRPNFGPVDVTEGKVLEWDAWSGGHTPPHRSAGYYPNATGYTRLWRQYWQLGYLSKPWRKHWALKWFFEGLLGSVEKPRYDKKASTWMEVSLVNWYYRETGDEETRFEIRIVSLPVMDVQDKVWGFRTGPLATHQKVAEPLVAKVLEALKAAKPSKAAALLRKRMNEQLEEADRQTPVPNPGTPTGSTQPATDTGQYGTTSHTTGGTTGAGGVKETGGTGSGVDLDSLLGGGASDAEAAVAKQVEVELEVPERKG